MLKALDDYIAKQIYRVLSQRRMPCPRAGYAKAFSAANCLALAGKEKPGLLHRCAGGVAPPCLTDDVLPAPARLASAAVRKSWYR